MAQDFMVAIIGSGTAIVVAVGGWITSFRLAAKGSEFPDLNTTSKVLNRITERASQ